MVHRYCCNRIVPYDESFFFFLFGVPSRGGKAKFRPGIVNPRVTDEEDLSFYLVLGEGEIDLYFKMNAATSYSVHRGRFLPAQMPCLSKCLY